MTLVHLEKVFDWGGGSPVILPSPSFFFPLKLSIHSILVLVNISVVLDCNGVVCFQLLDKGLKCIFYISEQTWPPGSLSIPQSLSGMPYPPALNFLAQGLGCPSPRNSALYNPDILSSPSFLLSPNSATPCLLRLNWPQSLGPVISPKSSFPINCLKCCLIWLELAHFPCGENLSCTSLLKIQVQTNDYCKV